MRCPNCGFNETPGAAACSNCSVIFGDLEARRREAPPEPAPPPRAKPEPADFEPPPRPSYFLAVKRGALISGALALLLFGRSLLGFIDGLLKADLRPYRPHAQARVPDLNRPLPGANIIVTRPPVAVQHAPSVGELNRQRLLQDQIRLNTQFQAIQEQARIQAQIRSSTLYTKPNYSAPQYQQPPSPAKR